MLHNVVIYGGGGDFFFFLPEDYITGKTDSRLHTPSKTGTGALP